MKINNYLRYAVTTIGALLLAITGLNAWTGPSATAPNSNVAAPINIGTTAQWKMGTLAIGKNGAAANDMGWAGALEVNGQVKAARYYDDNSAYYVDGNGSSILNGVWANSLAVGGGAQIGVNAGNDQLCLNGSCITAWPTGGGAPAGTVAFVGYYTNPTTNFTVPAGVTKLIITASGGMACPLPGDFGSGVQLNFYANGSRYAQLGASAGNNNGAWVAVSGSATGVINVSGGQGVSLSLLQTTLNRNQGIHSQAWYPNGVQCPNGSWINASFTGYLVQGVY